MQHQASRPELSDEEYDQLYEEGPEAVVDFGQAQEDANMLYEAGEGMIGTDESAFLSIFAMRHQYQLRATFAEYEKVDIYTSYDE